MIEIVAQQVWLVPGATDMRKSIDGLTAIVTYAIHQNPLSQQLFVFCSRDRSRLKILFWDQNGFWLFYKRLERGRFRWPVHSTNVRYTPSTGMALGRLVHRTDASSSCRSCNHGRINLSCIKQHLVLH